MNKLLKRTLIIGGVIIVILALLIGVVMWKMKSAISGFATMETGRVVDNIFAVKDNFANFFIIQDDEGYVIIDCGMEQTTSAEQMKILGINPDEVSAVLLTHTDGDHIGALALFNKAKLYMSREEEKMINGTKSKKWWMRNSIPRTDYTLLDDCQKIQIGNLKIEGILVPGHSSGTMAYLIDDRYLFTGDILSLKDGKIAPIPSIFNMDSKQAIQSMEIIRHIPNAKYIITSHWGYTDDFIKAIMK